MSAPTNTDYPTSLDDTTSLPNPTATDTTKGVPHAELHTVQNKAIIAVQTKIGTGASTPTANKVLMGDGTGTSSWSSAVPQASIYGLVSDLAAKADTADLADVATSGSYNNLSDTPDIPATFDDLTDGTTNKAFTNTEKTKLSGIESSADVTDATNVGSSVHGVTGKTTPVDADELPLIDSAASNILKKLTWSNIKATLKTYFDTLYSNYTDTDADSRIAAASIDDLSDVDTSTTAPTDTQVLAWNNTASKWEPADASGGSGTGGANLSTSLTSTTVTIASDSGTDAEIDSADATNAGIITSADWQKLDGIESSADVTDATNVDAAGATMNTDTDVSGNSWVLDEDTFSSDSATKVPTQQSVKAYIASNGGIVWNNVTSTSQSAAVKKGYIANNAGLVTVTLPSTAAIGDVVRVAGAGAGGWKIAQNASQLINFGTSTTTTGTGGSLASVNDYDAVELLCIVTNTTWTVISSQGNITIV